MTDRDGAIAKSCDVYYVLAKHIADEYKAEWCELIEREITLLNALSNNVSESLGEAQDELASIHARRDQLFHLGMPQEMIEKASEVMRAKVLKRRRKFVFLAALASLLLVLIFF